MYLATRTFRLVLHVSPTYNVLRHMYIVLPDDLAKGKRLVGGIVPVVPIVAVVVVVIVVECKSREV